MTTGSLIAFWGISLLLVLTPGADWAYTITAGLRYRSIVPAIGGLLSGYVLITAAVALGAAALIAGTPGALPTLTFAGAAYLAWLGIDGIRHPAAPSEAGTTDASFLAQIGGGMATSGLNPKALILFMALLPQFTDVGGSWPVAVQIMALGGLHMLSCTVVYTVVGTSSRTVLRSRPSTARLVSRISGVAMLVISIGLIVEQLV